MQKAFPAGKVCFKIPGNWYAKVRFETQYFKKSMTEEKERKKNILKLNASKRHSLVLAYSDDAEKEWIYFFWSRGKKKILAGRGIEPRLCFWKITL